MQSRLQHSVVAYVTLRQVLVQSGSSVSRRAVLAVLPMSNDTASLGRGEGREDIGTGNRVGPQCLLHKCLMAETGPESRL